MIVVHITYNNYFRKKIQMFIFTLNNVKYFQAYYFDI